MSSLLDAAHDVVRRVFEGSDGLDIVPRARLVAAGRDGYAYKRSHLVALRTGKILAGDPPSTWGLGKDQTRRQTSDYSKATPNLFSLR